MFIYTENDNASDTRIWTNNIIKNTHIYFKNTFVEKQKTQLKERKINVKVSAFYAGLYGIIYILYILNMFVYFCIFSIPIHKRDNRRLVHQKRRTRAQGACSCASRRCDMSSRRSDNDTNTPRPMSEEPMQRFWICAGASAPPRLSPGAHSKSH